MKHSNPPCPICDGRNTKMVKELDEDWDGSIREVYVVVCHDCETGEASARNRSNYGIGYNGK